MAAQTQTSSARPEALARYAQQGLHLVQEQLGQASRLSTILERFQSTCREYPVSVGGLAQQVNHRAQEADQVGGWVRQVGIRFAQADALQQAIMQRGQVLGSMMAADSASVSRSWWPPKLDWGKVRRLVWRLLAPAWLQALWAIADWWRGLGNPQVVDPGDIESMPSFEVDTDGLGSETVVPPQSPFGEHIVSGGGFPRYGNGTLHTGVDIKPNPASNTVIHPIGPGEVFAVGCETKTDEDGKMTITGYGYYVVVKHTLADGNVVYSRYAHLREKSALQPGQWISVLTPLGVMGSTGRSTGPHLHLEVYEEGAYTGYNSKAPDAKTTTKPNAQTMEQKMLDEFYNPLEVIEGKMGWEFQANDPRQT